MSEYSTSGGSGGVHDTSKPTILQPQPIRAQRDSTSIIVLQVPVSKDAQGSRKVGIGDRTFDVKISERDRDRGYAEIAIDHFWNCVSIPSGLGFDHDFCKLTLRVCFDGDCIEY